MSNVMPVYSDFSHMAVKNGLGDMSFVVSLREDSRNAEALMRRVFPMTKLVPAIKKEKKKIKKERLEEKICMRPDCIARREKLVDLQDENKPFRMKLKAVESKVETTKNKISLTEKSIIMAEEKNDILNGQIEDAQSKIFSIETDVEKGEGLNENLRKQLAALHQVIEDIKNQTEDQSNQLRDIVENKSDRKLVFSKNKDDKNKLLATEVSYLSFPKDDDDSD
jgi:chromosome segregation ATPase